MASNSNPRMPQFSKQTDSKLNVDLSLSGTSSSSSRCQCCPYGFHIDTDFVRYCDALLAALNAQRTTKTSSILDQKSIHRKVGSSSISSTASGIVNANENTATVFECVNSSDTNYRWRAQCRRKFNLGRTNPEMLSTLSPNASLSSPSPTPMPSPLTTSSSSYSALQFISNVPTQSIIETNETPDDDDEERAADDDDDSSTKNFLKYCQSFNDEDETDFDRCGNAIHSKVDCRVNCGVNYFDSDANVTRQQLPKVIGYDEYSSASSLSPITSAFEVKTIAATKNTAQCVGYRTEEKPAKLNSHPFNETISIESSETFSESGASSSCASSVSRSVLEQIRQHLAFSLERVQTLEQQVSNIPALREQIDMLEAEKQQLETKLMENVVDSDSVKTVASIHVDDPQAANQSETFDDQQQQQVHETGTKHLKSVGTVTLHEIAGISHQTQSEMNCEPKFMSESTDTQDLFDSAFTEISVQTEEYCCPKADIDSLDNSRDSSFFKSTLGSLTDDSSRSNSTNSILRLCHNCGRGGVHSNNSTNESGNVSAVTSRMAQSVISTDDERHCRSPASRVSIPTGLIKADSGISVERQSRTIDSSCDGPIVEENITIAPSANSIITNQSLQTCSSAESSNSEELSSSSDGESTDKIMRIAKKSSKKVAKPPLDMKKVRPSTEVRIALAILNENLLDLQKADRSIFNKNLAYIKRAWFQVSSKKESDSRIVKLYLDCFEEFSQKLLDFVVNLSDNNGNTAMHYAISFESFDIASVLLNTKVCNVNSFNKAGYSATMLAALCDFECDDNSDSDSHTNAGTMDNVSKAVVQQLFQRADLNLKAKQNGQTALMLASSHGRAEICRLLLDSGADVNLQDNDGSTALMCAAEHGHSEVISLLLANFECDPHLEDNDGMCALKIALNSGHNECAIRLYIGSRLSESNCSFHSSSSSLRNPLLSAAMTTSQAMVSSSSSSSSSSSPNSQTRHQPRYVPEPAVSFPYDCIASFSRSLQHLSISTPRASLLSRRTVASGGNKSSNKSLPNKAANYSLSTPLSPL